MFFFYLYIYLIIFILIKYKKSYVPHCSPSCNYGKCVNINQCNCDGTSYTGLYCNEHYKYERNKGIDIFYFIITFILSLMTTISLIGICVFRKAYIIKGGKNILMY